MQIQKCLFSWHVCGSSPVLPAFLSRATQGKWKFFLICFAPRYFSPGRISKELNWNESISEQLHALGWHQQLLWLVFPGKVNILSPQLGCAKCCWGQMSALHLWDQTGQQRQEQHHCCQASELWTSSKVLCMRTCRVEKGFFYFLQAAQFPWAGTRCNEKSATWPTETDTKFQGLHLFIGLKCPVSIYCKWKQGIAAIAQKQWHKVGALALMYSSGSLRETLSSKGPELTISSLLQLPHFSSTQTCSVSGHLLCSWQLQQPAIQTVPAALQIPFSSHHGPEPEQTQRYSLDRFLTCRCIPPFKHKMPGAVPCYCDE